MDNSNYPTYRGAEAVKNNNENRETVPAVDTHYLGHSLNLKRDIEEKEMDNVKTELPLYKSRKAIRAFKKQVYGEIE